MQYFIYDTSVHGITNLMALKACISSNQFVLDERYDKDMMWCGPWLFQINDSDLEIMRQKLLLHQNYLWFSSEASLQELTLLFQKVIYQNYPQSSRVFFRCWDLKVIMEDLKQNNSQCKLLFQLIDHLFLISDEYMQAYYLDHWGVLNTKTISSIIK